MFEVLINFIILEPEQWIFLNQTIHVLNSSASSSPYFIIQKKKRIDGFANLATSSCPWSLINTVL